MPDESRISRFATIDIGQKSPARLKVVGVGGGGCNAIESMIRRGLVGVEYVAINTDSQALVGIDANHKIQIGVNITRGLGAGADPNVGKKSIEEDREKVAEVLAGADMVFITCGMGGGTGTGAAPVVASIAKSIGSLVVGIVTKPFNWEGKQRLLNAEQGIQELKQYVDSLIVIPNQRLLSVMEKNTGMFAAFDKPNEVLYEATRGIADIINCKGLVNVDFADVRTVMNMGGDAIMGCGIASGENRAIEAAQKAISSPLLEGVNINGAKHVLINISASSNLTMEEVEAGNNVIYAAAGEEVNVIFGVVCKEELNEYISYTVIATGFNNKSAPQNKTTFTIKKSKPAEPRGGFDFDGQNLEVPTYLRVKGTNAPLKEETEENEMPESGFKFDNSRYNWAKDKAQKRKEENDEDEDSSSFLRMIMD